MPAMTRARRLELGPVAALRGRRFTNTIPGRGRHFVVRADGLATRSRAHRTWWSGVASAEQLRQK